MPTKDEILKKKGKFPEQLNLVTNLDDDKNKLKGRLLLIFFLILTIGSSASLWAYREYRDGKLSINFSLPKLPRISTPITTDKNVWQICFFEKNNGKLIYQQNCAILELPNVIVKNNIDLVKSSLPNGLIISESISNSLTEINYISNISSPKFNYLLTIKIYGTYPLELSQNLIPKIVSDLYWRYSQK